MASLKSNGFFRASNVEARGLDKLRDTSDNGMDFYSWWSSLAAKIYVPESMDLVSDMDT